MALTKTPIELSSTPGIVDNSNDTAITIDSSERVLIGKTATGLGASGTEINPNGYIQVTEDQSPPLYLNRLSTDGNIVNFYKDGADVGSIGTGSGLLTIGKGTGNLVFADALVAPCSDSSVGSSNGVVDLGASSRRFKDIYLSGGVNFSANANAGGMTSELLDDYEEGAWTPTDASGASLSLTVNAASYTKIGRSCYISAYITYPTNSSIAAQQLGGLPFTTRSPNTYAQLSVRVVAAAFTTDNVTFQTQTASNYGKIHFATTVPDNSDLSGLSFLISGVYETV
jgi:hypothetical protein